MCEIDFIPRKIEWKIAQKYLQTLLLEFDFSCVDICHIELKKKRDLKNHLLNFRNYLQLIIVKKN